MKNQNKDLKKKSFRRGIVAVGLIAALSLTGCEFSYKEKNKDNDTQTEEALLNDTIFEGAITAYVLNNEDYDLEPAILKYKGEDFVLGKVYFDIVNGEYIARSSSSFRNNVRRVKQIDINDSILNYLTEEDFNKLRNKEFTKEDENRLICQIRDKMEEELQEAKASAKTK